MLREELLNLPTGSVVELLDEDGYQADLVGKCSVDGWGVPFVSLNSSTEYTSDDLDDYGANILFTND